MTAFGEDILTQSGRGAGINFLMDYNTERMDQDIEQEQHIENREAMIYIETIGNKETDIIFCWLTPNICWNPQLTACWQKILNFLQGG